MESELIFGKLILANRKAAGLTQQELAKRAGISKAYIGTIENARPHTVTGAISKPEREVAINIINAINSALPEDAQMDMESALHFLGYTPPSEKKPYILGQVPKVLPHELAIMDFDGFDDDDLKEIANFISYKRAQKGL